MTILIFHCIAVKQFKIALIVAHCKAKYIYIYIYIYMGILQMSSLAAKHLQRNVSSVIQARKKPYCICKLDYGLRTEKNSNIAK